MPTPQTTVKIQRVRAEDLDTLRIKAQAWDCAVEWLQGRMDNEKLMTIHRILAFIGPVEMMVMLGETRSYRNVKVIRDRGWGRMFLYRTPSPYPGEPWGFDNGAFGAYAHKTSFPTETFVKRLARAQIKCPAPYLAVVPDIVAAGLESLAFSEEWLNKLVDIQWPWYLAVQDGMSPSDVEYLLPVIQGIFLGGSDAFKPSAPEWGRFAHSHGKRFHYGRAGTLDKLSMALESGADSCDSAFPL